MMTTTVSVYMKIEHAIKNYIGIILRKIGNNIKHVDSLQEMLHNTSLKLIPNNPDSMKYMKTIGLLLFAFCYTSCSSDEIILTENGKSTYEIIHMGTAFETEYQAAITLQEYIFKISGAELPLVDESSQTMKVPKIYVGNIKKVALQQQEISIKTENKNIYISGGSSGALTNAVFEFLENNLGCKWYAPNATYIPVSKTITLYPINYNYTPDIVTRTVHSRLFYENEEFAKQHKVTTEAFPNYVPAAKVHTFNKFMPEEVFYKSHPEYYALRGKKRLPTQLCLTNPIVLKIVKDSVAALFKRNPDASVISVSQDDNQQYCQCEHCNKIDTEEGSPSGTMIYFVNSVAEAFPQKTISTLAYQHTRKPPKTSPLENVLITLCSIECDRSAPIAKKCMDFADDLTGWSKLTDNIRIWDYTTQFTNFLSPFPNLYTLQPNIQLFRDNNAKWIFEQHSNNPSELFELRSYITAKLLWNPDQDFNALISEFTNGYYQEAGPFVKEYVDLIHSKLKEDVNFFLFLYGDPSEAFSSYLNPKLLQEYTALFNAAAEAVADKPEVLKRVKMARMGVDFAVLEASRKNSTPTYSLTKTNENGIQITNPTVALLLDNFTNTAKDNNITLMNEMGFTVGEYGANYVSALETAKRTNKAKGKNVVSITSPKKYADENPMVLTDGALGGSNFYANWLGYEGNTMEVIVDLDEKQSISTISMAFLQVTNHVVFFPTSVTYYGSGDNKTFTPLGTVTNPNPLTKSSKINDIYYFELELNSEKYRYIKVLAKNTETPYWHHAAGLPSWIFADEIIID
ncbi:MAG: hypothetical protein ACJAWH_002257 [Maribacter sp.]|jgi:hypothetical protein